MKTRILLALLLLLSSCAGKSTLAVPASSEAGLPVSKAADLADAPADPVEIDWDEWVIVQGREDLIGPVSFAKRIVARDLSPAEIAGLIEVSRPAEVVFYNCMITPESLAEISLWSECLRSLRFDLPYPDQPTPTQEAEQAFTNSIGKLSALRSLTIEESGRMFRHVPLLLLNELKELQEFRTYLDLDPVDELGWARLAAHPALVALHLANTLLDQTRGLGKLVGLERLTLIHAHLLADDYEFLTGLSNLRSLRIAGSQVSDSCIFDDSVAAKLSRLPRFEDLALTNTVGLTGNCFHVLASGVRLKSLTLGYIGRDSIGDGILEAVARFRYLEFLDVDSGNCSITAIRKLASLTQLKHLRLGLWIRGLDDADVAEVFGGHANLEHVEVSGRASGLAAIPHLRANWSRGSGDWQGDSVPTTASRGAFANHHPKLVLLFDADSTDVKKLARLKYVESIDLRFVSGVDLDALRSIARMPRLQTLWLPEYLCTADAVAMLESARELTSLRLKHESQLDPAFVRGLSKLPALRILDLDWAELSKEAFAELGQLRRVQAFALSNFEFTDKNVAMLRTMTQLRALHLNAWDFDERWIEALRELQVALPRCYIPIGH